MNWYRENRWLGNFLIAFSACLLFALWLLYHVRREFLNTSALFHEIATEHSRLEHLTPFPNEENFRKTQTGLKEYAALLNKTKEELKAHAVPAAGLAPNEFQAHLHHAIIDVTERARINRVKLPGNFHLGFDEFTSALPDASSSSLLGQQLTEVELLINILIGNQVDTITSLKRSAPRTGSGAVSNLPRKPVGVAQQRSAVEQDVVELGFDASPSALRKVLNGIANSDRHFFVIRTLHIRNQRQEGPIREQGEQSAPSATGSAGAIKFFIGNEHLETAAIVELLRFNF